MPTRLAFTAAPASPCVVRGTSSGAAVSTATNWVARRLRSGSAPADHAVLCCDVLRYAVLCSPQCAGCRCSRRCEPACRKLQGGVEWAGSWTPISGWMPVIGCLQELQRPAGAPLAEATCTSRGCTQDPTYCRSRGRPGAAARRGGRCGWGCRGRPRPGCWRRSRT